MRIGSGPGELVLPGATSVLALALASVVALVACGHDAPAGASRPASAAAAIAQVHLRSTTVAELRSTLGDPDEQAADGSLVYRFEGSRGHGDRRRNEIETVHFRFANGTLSKICRNRS